MTTKLLTLILVGALAFASLPVEAHGFHGPRIGIGLGFGPYYPYGWYDPWFYPYPYPYAYGPYERRAPVAEEQTSDRLFAYPTQGQTAEQTTLDRKECNDWAVNQSGIDPATAKKRAKAQHMDEYNRAFVACMEGRNYTVK
jgi:hypothetical protein